MSLMGLFDIGRSGIFANQMALRVASNNIANVNTPGYSRQDVIMQIANPVQSNGNYIGRGVGDVDVRRHFDNFTFLQIIGQSSKFGRSEALQSGLSNIEQIFNEAKDFGLSSTMQEYFNSWQEVATNPDGTAQRSNLIIKAEAFVNAATQIEGDIKSTLKFVNDQVKDVVDQINVLSKNIAEVNGKVQEVEAGGVEVANTFRDQREKMMKDLSELINYDWNENKDGTVTIVAGRRSIVAGVASYDLSSSLNLEGNREIYNGGTVVTPFIQSGKLGGYIAGRDNIETNALTGLRKLIASITQETNYLHAYNAANNTYDLDGNQGSDFFSTLQAYSRDDTKGGSGAIMSATIPDIDPSVLNALDEYDIVFSDAANFQVQNHVTGEVISSNSYTSGSSFSVNGVSITITDSSGGPAAGDTFFVSPIHNAIQDFNVVLTDGRQVAAARSTAALPGDNTNALGIVEMYGKNITNLNSDSFNNYYADIVATAGSLSQSANDSLKFEDNLMFELNNRRESLSGVSLDEEAANLIRYQRAYEAGARIIKITDELLETIINL